MEFITRDYNSITLNKDRGTITKISSEKRLGDEAFYYLQIPSKVAHYFPRAISSAQKGQIGLFLLLVPFPMKLPLLVLVEKKCL